MMNLKELYECIIESLTKRESYSALYWKQWNSDETILVIYGKVSIDMTRTSYRLKRAIRNKTKEYKVETQEAYVFPKGFCHGFRKGKNTKS